MDASVSPSQAAAARAAADAFLAAVVRGDEAAARAALIVREGESVDFATMHASTASYALGEPAVEGDTVVVVATIVAKPGQDVPPSLPIVLRRADARWKIDMGASMNRLLGVDLGALMSEMVKGVGDAMAAGFSAVAGALGAEPAADVPASPPVPAPAPKRKRPASSPKRRPPRAT